MQWRVMTLRTLVLIVESAADALPIEVEQLGPPTLKHSKAHRDADPDAAFAIRDAPRHTRRTDGITVSGGPPADLVINVAGEGASSDELGAYAELGVPEIWRFDEPTNRVAIFRLRNGKYREKRESAVLVPLTSELLTRLVHTSRSQPSQVWLRELESWLRTYD